MSKNAQNSIVKANVKLKYNYTITNNMAKPRTPRAEARAITEGKEKPHHIGKKSKEVLIQEIWSLDNTKEAFRKGDHYTKRKALVQELRGKYGLEYSMQLWRKTHKP